MTAPLRLRRGLPFLLAALAILPASAEEGPDPFRDCEAEFRADPEGSATCGCFRRVGLDQKLLPEAVDRLTSHLARDRDNPCLQYNLGRLQLRLGGDSAGDLLHAAAAGYGARGEAAAEFWARINLSRLHSGQGRAAAALDQLTLAREALGSQDDPMLFAQVEFEQARLRLIQGEDLARVDRWLRGVEARVFPDGPVWLQRDTLLELGNVRFLRGRYSDAEAFFRRMAEVTREAGQSFGESTARLNLAITHMAQLPAVRSREEAAVLLRQALAMAVESGHSVNEAEARRRLGKLLGGVEGRRELERSVTLARKLHDPALLSKCLGSLAAEMVEESPDDARRWIGEIVDSILPSLTPAERVVGWFDRMKVDWATLPRQEAIRNALGELRQIERLRQLQRSGTGRAESFAAWTEVYHWLSGRLLETADGANRRADQARAFSVTESMRARALLDALDSDPLAPIDQEDPLRQEWDGVQEELIASNRRLLDPGLGAEERAAAVEDQQRLEDREADLRDRIAGGLARVDLPVSRPEFATLERIEEALKKNEAFLSFQVALWQNVYENFAGGAWLLVTTRRGTRTYRLPDRVRLEPAIRAFRSLFPRRDGFEVAPSVTLFDDLLAEALAELPPAIDRLVVVPDGHLHRLPFGALRAAEPATPLVARYQISIVPSATLWLRWRQAEPAPARPIALALADPLLAEANLRATASERGWSLARGVRLDSLPHARREGRAVLRHLGRSSELLVGGEASESALKALEIRRFGILHFAAHALVDGEKPHRSAVVLAPGSVEEDGLLQPREIARLDLGGTLVVLSTCHSATGDTLLGEGPLSLARAFFQAGARAVVASLWPLRDDEAAALFEPFYRHLGRGASVAGALGAAQQERIEAGLPAAAWAGVVVLGDGALVPLPGGRPRAVSASWLLGLAACAAVLLAVAGRALLRRRKTREPPGC